MDPHLSDSRIQGFSRREVDTRWMAWATALRIVNIGLFSLVDIQSELVEKGGGFVVTWSAVEHLCNGWDLTKGKYRTWQAAEVILTVLTPVDNLQSLEYVGTRNKVAETRELGFGSRFYLRLVKIQFKLHTDSISTSVLGMRGCLCFQKRPQRWTSYPLGEGL